MDWHVPLLVIALALAASAAFAAWRVRRERRAVEHRVAIIAAREAAFIGILQRLSAARTLEDILLETVHAIERIIPDCIGSIQLIENGKIRNGAAPGLPKFYNDLVEGLADRRRRRLLRIGRRPAQAGHRRGRVRRIPTGRRTRRSRARPASPPAGRIR